MTTKHLPLTAGLLAWPAGPGSSPAARRAARAWRSDPTLARYATPGAAAVALQTADRAVAKALIGALARRPEPDAAVAVLAGLAPRLARIALRRAPYGLDAADVADLEADLVSAC